MEPKTMLFVPNKIKLRLGFTLVELLVVISIIGILVAIATTNMITAQKQARDSRRISDMQESQTALETYYATNQEYPVTAVERNNAFDSGTAPVDPKGDSYSWLVDSDSYCVCSTMESKIGNASSLGTVSGCNWTGDPLPYFCVQNRQ